MPFPVLENRMSDFAQKFVLVWIVVGLLTVVVGLAVGAMSFGFAFAALFAFGVAFWVLWDHAREDARDAEYIQLGRK